MTVTIVAFLRARYDEIEAAAKAAGGGSWVAEERGYSSYAVAQDGDPIVYDEGSPTEEQAAHIALHDPAYVLADIAAKRRILGLCQLDVNDDGQPVFLGGYGEAYWDVLRELAAPFRAHPDFDPAWSTE